MTLDAICLVIPQRMRISNTVTEIWRLRDNGVTTLTFWGQWRHWSRDHSTRGGRLFLVVHCDYGFIWQRYGDMAVWSSSRKALPRTEVGRRSVDRSSILHWSHILFFATL